MIGDNRSEAVSKPRRCRLCRDDHGRIDGGDLFFAGTDGNVYHLSASAPDLDPPTFENVMPQLAEKGFLDPGALLYVGAIIQDEGTGLPANQVHLSLDGKDLTSDMAYDAKSDYYYYRVPPQSPLNQGMHRLVITATDARGNTGTLTKDFILAISANRERLDVSIGGEFVPKHLVVQPGTVITWTNNAGSPRTIVADQQDIATGWHLSSDTLYPDGIPAGSTWVWIVPADIEMGTQIYYHCRLQGQPGDGAHFGTGLVGLIEIGNPQSTVPGGTAPTPTDATPPPAPAGDGL